MSPADDKRKSKIVDLVIIIAIVLMIIAIVLSVTSLRQQGTVNSQQQTLNETVDRLDDAENGACFRLQRIRERGNVTEAREFLILVLVVHNPRNTAAVKKQFQQYVDTALYLPPTICNMAISNPNEYAVPPGIPFSDLGVEFAGKVQAAALSRSKKQPVPKCWRLYKNCGPATIKGPQ